MLMVSHLAGFGASPPVDGGNDSFTKILLHFDGADASTTITDANVGGSAHTWTAGGNAQIDTAQSQFGGASLLLDGTGDWVETPDSGDFTLGSGEFTIDFWFNYNGGSGLQKWIAGHGDGTLVNSSFFMDHQAANTIRCGVCVGAATTTVATTTTITTTGWHHLAFVRTGNTLKLFLDGTQEGGNVAFSSTVNNSANKFVVGAFGEFTGSPWLGWIDEFRLSVGIARWTANFTPPTGPYS